MIRTVLFSVTLLGLAAASQAQNAPRPAPAQPGPAFVDADGDDICDNGQARCGNRGRRGGRAGQGIGPQDGRGRGTGPAANCDGTGPHGQGRRRARR